MISRTITCSQTRPQTKIKISRRSDRPHLADEPSERLALSVKSSARLTR
jgi:hypothetical protein